MSSSQGLVFTGLQSCWFLGGQRLRQTPYLRSVCESDTGLLTAVMEWRATVLTNLIIIPLIHQHTFSTWGGCAWVCIPTEFLRTPLLVESFILGGGGRDDEKKSSM